MKGNRVFMTHLTVNKIFINVTNLTTVRRDLWVWCTLSHLNQTCQNKAVEELNQQLNITGTVELSQYLTKKEKDKRQKTTCMTRSLVVAGGEDDKDNGIEQLLLFNNMTQEKKDQYPYTGHWYFVPFNQMGQIRQEMILGMMENQNHFLEKQTSVAVQGFCDIVTIVKDPDVSLADKTDTSMDGLDPVKVMLIVWILRKRVTDGSKLITSIKKGPHGVHYFCTNEEKKDEMMVYIDALEHTIHLQFRYEVYSDATEGESVTRKFKRKN
eukprot:12746721-Ditylum_brightwellii.AAC.1